MLASRIHRISHLTWKVFILVMLVVSFTFCVTEALASPVVSAEHAPPEGSYVILESTFHLNKQVPTLVDELGIIVSGVSKVSTIRVKLDSEGAWYGCKLSCSDEQVAARCDTTKGMRLQVVDMDGLQVIVTEKSSLDSTQQLFSLI